MNAATRAAGVSAVSALLLAAVWFLWPVGLGGATAYVVTHGISMEPRFHTGDLAILRPADGYSVGDIVAYRSATLDTIVMHRIVDVDGSHFVIQGDNNDWLDRDQPTEDQILGTLLLRVPKGGKALGALESPGALAVIASGVLALAGATRVPRRRGARGRRHGSRHAQSVGLSMPALSFSAFTRPSFSMPIRALARQVALGAGAVTLLAAVGAGVLFALPPTQTTSEKLQVTQRGEFTYTGTAQAGTTYPTGVISTGDTVWTNLATGLAVTFTNTVTGPRLADVRGAMRLDVTVSSGDGWSTYLNSSPVTELRNGTAAASVDVDIARARALVDQHFAEIGQAASGATLTVAPAVATTGSAAGVPFSAGSAHGLDFTLDASSLRPTVTGGALQPSTQTAVTVDEVVPRTFTVLKLSIPIGVARIAVLAVLGVAVVALAGGAWIGRVGRGDVADRFLVRHAARILPVTRFTPGDDVIDVSDVEALHRVAERFDTLVLHHAGPDEDVFAVRDVETTYRFVVPGGRTAREKPPVPAPVPEDLTAPLPRVVPGGLRGSFA